MESQAFKMMLVLFLIASCASYDQASNSSVRSVAGNKSLSKIKSDLNNCSGTRCIKDNVVHLINFIEDSDGSTRGTNVRVQSINIPRVVFYKQSARCSGLEIPDFNLNLFLEDRDGPEANEPIQSYRVNQKCYKAYGRTVREVVTGLGY